MKTKEKSFQKKKQIFTLEVKQNGRIKKQTSASNG